MRRTKVAQIYKNAGNLRAVQLLRGHSTVRYLGIGLDDALTLSEGCQPVDRPCRSALRCHT